MVPQTSISVGGGSNPRHAVVCDPARARRVAFAATLAAAGHQHDGAFAVSPSDCEPTRHRGHREVARRTRVGSHERARSSTSASHAGGVASTRWYETTSRCRTSHCAKKCSSEPSTTGEPFAVVASIVAPWVGSAHVGATVTFLVLARRFHKRCASRLRRRVAADTQRAGERARSVRSTGWWMRVVWMMAGPLDELWQVVAVGCRRCSSVAPRVAVVSESRPCGGRGWATTSPPASKERETPSSAARRRCHVVASADHVTSV